MNISPVNHNSNTKDKLAFGAYKANLSTTYARELVEPLTQQLERLGKLADINISDSPLTYWKKYDAPIPTLCNAYDSYNGRFYSVQSFKYGEHVATAGVTVDIKPLTQSRKFAEGTSEEVYSHTFNSQTFLTLVKNAIKQMRETVSLAKKAEAEKRAAEYMALKPNNLRTKELFDTRELNSLRRILESYKSEGVELPAELVQKVNDLAKNTPIIQVAA